MAVQVTVAAPARQTRLGGIRPVATWVTNARIGAAEEVVYISDGCSFPMPAIGLCFGEQIEEEKEGVGVDHFTGISEPFALYGGVECWLGPDSDFADRARNILIAGEDREIEGRLAAWADGANGGSDLVTGTIVEVIGGLEANADAAYLGRPILLMSRSDAVRAASEMAIEYGIDGLPYTVNGTPVVATAGVIEGMVYMVGAVTVLRSEIGDIDTIDHRFNKQWAVAEAVYSVIVDCNFRARGSVATP